MKPFKHLHTINKHRREVRKICFKIGIGWQGIWHDLSKYSFIEFWNGAKYYQGNKSPNDKERRERGYSKAWIHHKGRNKHHFEYWFDVDVKTKQYSPIKMPIKYLKEMFADRVAASKIYRGKDYDNGYPLEYLLNGRAKELMHPDTYNKLYELLLMLKEKGEKETYYYVKSLKEY